MRNAGSYARLKFAMDYWCALWFWPIDQAELLPTRSEFLFDMSLILEGTMASVKVNDSIKSGQVRLFPTEMEQLAMETFSIYGKDNSVVDLPRLRKENPRLDLAARIAEQNHFTHWELEFADLFAERGGFDLIIGNPPWIKIEWNEQGVLSDSDPMFAVKKLTATQTTHERAQSLENAITRNMYFAEYESTSGEQAFLNAVQNYPALKGQQTNLFKCFLPLAWEKNCESGVAAFVHPEGVYDDPKGGALREKLYPRLRYHFQFANERKLFPEVDHHTQFSLNVYGGLLKVSFDTISNLYDAKTIVECYEGDASAPIPGIKDGSGEWNTIGHPNRVIHVTQKNLAVFAKLLDGSDEWKKARLPVLHCKQLLEILECFAEQRINLGTFQDSIYTTQMWNETGAQSNNIIERKVQFPESDIQMIYSGPHIGVANPLFKTPRSKCVLNSDYDSIDLTGISEKYLARSIYVPLMNPAEYAQRAPATPWGTYIESYKLLARRMLNQSGERTLIPTIGIPGSGHIHTVFGLAFKKNKDLITAAGLMASVVYDGYIKITGRSDVYFETLSNLPYFDNRYAERIRLLSLLLNCVNDRYKVLWEKSFENDFTDFKWAKNDTRLWNKRFVVLNPKWSISTPLRTDYERRQALVEIDVLTAMALGMTLNQLKTIYRIQFPVLQSYEADTWYDANGRITFTNNRSLTGVGFSRPEWENAGAVQPVRRGDAPWDGVMKHAPAGYVFARTIMDDTMPGGPVERTIEYVAPFDRCDREQDYETAWKFFEEKYKEG